MLIDIHTHRNAPDSGFFAIRNLYKGFDAAAEEEPCSIGIHPCHMNDYEAGIGDIARLAARENVLAIGECGLDRGSDKDMALQLDVFTRQIGIACKVDKPVVIHCVRAFEELLTLVDALKPTVPLIAHGYNKKPYVAKRLLEQNIFLSFGAAILNESWPAAEALRNTPVEMMFLETDGAEIHIGEIYRRAAELRDTTVETLILRMKENTARVFKQVL